MGRAHDGSQGPAFDAVRTLGDGGFAPGAGFAYRVLDAPLKEPNGERRAFPRRRTRLRSGKLLDAANDFLADCQIYDESDGGARLRLLDAPRPASGLRLYQDRPERLIEVRLAWRADREMGLAFVGDGAPRRIRALDLAALRDGRHAVRS